MIRMRHCHFLTAMVLGTALPVFAALTVNGLRCEGVDQPEQVDTTTPRFSWRIETEVRAVRQATYQFRTTEIGGSTRSLGPAFETARVESKDSQWVTPPGLTVKPRSVYAWQVRVWDSQGQASD
jgi:alpha-L-rhamnosidase